MHITYKEHSLSLEDLPLDVGYASECVTCSKQTSEDITVGGHVANTTQLFITSPIVDSAFLNELKSLQQFVAPLEHINAYYITDLDDFNTPTLEGFEVLIDKDGEFGDMYGTRLIDSPLRSQLTKSVIVVSKDGAIFYDEFLATLNAAFNQDVLCTKILAAQNCYTGQGCH